MIALGYRWSGEIPIARCCFLPWCRLLCARLRCKQLQEFRHPRQLERRVLDSGQPYGPRELPLRKLYLYEKDADEDRTNTQ
jgi:hypothetical protein